MPARSADAIVIGAGIAGMAVGAELARDRSVLVLEMESAPASHATGRSAAAFIMGYGGPTVAPFTRAARGWFESRAEGMSEHALLAERGMLTIATTEIEEAHLGGSDDSGAVRLDARGALERFGALRPEVVRAAAWDASVADIDVMAAFEACRRAFRSRGGQLLLGDPVGRLTRSGGSWVVDTAAATHRSPLVVDAAGAWADRVAVSAGIPGLGLQALRRTICTFDAPAGLDCVRWPLLMDGAESFYVKPEGVGFLASPADETAQDPGDAKPAMEDVATALDRVRAYTTLDPHSVRSSWAGLRTFAPDRAPVLGPDPAAEGFAWCAGLGGWGISIAPAAARAVVSLIDSGRLPDDIEAVGGSAAAVVPGRFRA